MSQTSEIIKRELAAGERVLWTGQPKQGVFLRGADFLLIPFSLLWAGFAFFWEFQVFNTNAPIMFKLWGIPFMCVGVYIVFGRFLVEAKQRLKTHYAVTDKRIVIVSGLFTQNINSLNLRTLSDLSLSESGNGTGSIFFGGGSAMSFMYRGFSGWPGMSSRIGPHFQQITGARAVYETIRTAQNETN